MHAAGDTITVDERNADAELVGHADGLRERARSLRVQAGELVDVLATTYRRRASELELEAFLIDLHSGVDTAPLGAATDPTQN